MLKSIFTRKIIVFLIIIFCSLTLLAIIFPSAYKAQERAERAVIKSQMLTLGSFIENCLLKYINTSTNLTEYNSYPDILNFNKLCKDEQWSDLKNKFNNSDKPNNIVTNYNTYLKSRNRKEFAGYFLYQPIQLNNSNINRGYRIFYINKDGEIFKNEESGEVVFVDVSI